jgi:hypothetical protein
MKPAVRQPPGAAAQHQAQFQSLPYLSVALFYCSVSLRHFLVEDSEENILYSDHC